MGTDAKVRVKADPEAMVRGPLKFQRLLADPMLDRIKPEPDAKVLVVVAATSVVAAARTAIPVEVVIAESVYRQFPKSVVI